MSGEVLGPWEPGRRANSLIFFGSTFIAAVTAYFVDRDQDEHEDARYALLIIAGMCITVTSLARYSVFLRHNYVTVAVKRELAERYDMRGRDELLACVVAALVGGGSAALTEFLLMHYEVGSTETRRRYAVVVDGMVTSLANLFMHEYLHKKVGEEDRAFLSESRKRSSDIVGFSTVKMSIKANGFIFFSVISLDALTVYLLRNALYPVPGIACLSSLYAGLMRIGSFAVNEYRSVVIHDANPKNYDTAPLHDVLIDIASALVGWGLGGPGATLAVAK